MYKTVTFRCDLPLLRTTDVALTKKLVKTIQEESLFPAIDCRVLTNNKDCVTFGFSLEGAKVVIQVEEKQSLITVRPQKRGEDVSAWLLPVTSLFNFLETSFYIPWTLRCDWRLSRTVQGQLSGVNVTSVPDDSVFGPNSPLLALVPELHQTMLMQSDKLEQQKTAISLFKRFHNIYYAKERNQLTKKLQQAMLSRSWLFSLTYWYLDSIETEDSVVSRDELLTVLGEEFRRCLAKSPYDTKSYLMTLYSLKTQYHYFAAYQGVPKHSANFDYVQASKQAPSVVEKMVLAMAQVQLASYNATIEAEKFLALLYPAYAERFLYKKRTNLSVKQGNGTRPTVKHLV